MDPDSVLPVFRSRVFREGTEDLPPRQPRDPWDKVRNSVRPGAARRRWSDPSDTTLGPLLSQDSGVHELEDPLPPLDEVRQDHASVQRELPEHERLLPKLQAITPAEHQGHEVVPKEGTILVSLRIWCRAVDTPSSDLPDRFVSLPFSLTPGV